MQKLQTQENKTGNKNISNKKMPLKYTLQYWRTNYLEINECNKHQRKITGKNGIDNEISKSFIFKANQSE